MSYIDVLKLYGRFEGMPGKFGKGMRQAKTLDGDCGSKRIWGAVDFC